MTPGGGGASAPCGPAGGPGRVPSWSGSNRLGGAAPSDGVRRSPFRSTVISQTSSWTLGGARPAHRGGRSAGGTPIRGRSLTPAAGTRVRTPPRVRRERLGTPCGCPNAIRRARTHAGDRGARQTGCAPATPIVTDSGQTSTALPQMLQTSNSRRFHRATGTKNTVNCLNSRIRVCCVVLWQRGQVRISPGPRCCCFVPRPKTKNTARV